MNPNQTYATEEVATIKSEGVAAEARDAKAQAEVTIPTAAADSTESAEASTKAASATKAQAATTLGEFLDTHEDVPRTHIPDRLMNANLNRLNVVMQPVVNLLAKSEYTTFKEMLVDYLQPPLSHLGLLIQWTAMMVVSNGNIHTINTTIKNYSGRIFKVMEPGQSVEDVTVEEVSALMSNILFTPTEKGGEISESHANGIYRSICRVFEFGLREKLISRNVTGKIPEELIPHPDKSTYTVVQLTQEELGSAFKAMLNIPSTYANVKNFIFVYLVMVQKVRTAALLELTWQQIRGMFIAKELDPFITKILLAYKKVQADYLVKCGIDNEAGYVFVKQTKPGTTAEPAYRSNAYNWFRKYILDANDLPKATIDSLHSLPKAVYAEVDAFDKTRTDYDLPILGDIEVPEPGQMPCGGVKRSAEEIAAIKASREKLREAYLQKNPAVAEPKPSNGVQHNKAKTKPKSLSVFAKAALLAKQTSEVTPFG